MFSAARSECSPSPARTSARISPRPTSAARRSACAPRRGDNRPRLLARSPVICPNRAIDPASASTPRRRARGRWRRGGSVRGDHPHLRLPSVVAIWPSQDLVAPAGYGRIPRAPRPKDATVGRGPAPRPDASQLVVWRTSPVRWGPPPARDAVRRPRTARPCRRAGPRRRRGSRGRGKQLLEVGAFDPHAPSDPDGRQSTLIDPLSELLGYVDVGPGGVGESVVNDDRVRIILDV